MFITIWIFKSPVYKGFSVPNSQHFPGDGFPTLARGAPILLGFLRFRSLFLVPILGPLFRGFFGGDFSVHFALHLAVDLAYRSLQIAS
jgi:hypothetical protein